MFKGIIEGFKKRHIKNMTIQDNRKVAFHNMETAKKCTLFWVAEDVSLSTVNRILETLSKHMEVCLLSYMRQPKLLLEKDKHTIYVEESSISYGGNFNDVKLKEVLGRKDDLFIDLSQKAEELSDYMVKYAKTECKVGMAREGVKHDIDIDGTKNVDEFIDRMFGVLTKINTY